MHEQMMLRQAAEVPRERRIFLPSMCSRVFMAPMLTRWQANRGPMTGGR